jgi:hypothetical protein
MIDNFLDLRDFMRAKRADEAARRDLMAAKRADEAARLRHAADEDAIVAAYERVWFPDLGYVAPETVAAKLGQSDPTGLDDFAALGGGMGSINHV